MSLIPLRRHAIATTLHTLPGVLLYQHLLCPNIIILLGRFALQAQLSTPRYVSPHSSLRLWVGFIFIVNTSAYALHWVDTTMGLNDEKALILDFVGLKQPPSGATVLILDIIIFLVQLVTVYVAYLCDPLPISTTTLTVLLPPVEISEDPLLPRAHENNEGDGEVQVWTVRRRRSQWKGKGKAGGIYRNRSDHGEEGVVDLNEDDVENERSSFLRTGSTSRTSGHFTDVEEDNESTFLTPSSSSYQPVPLIFDITLSQLLKHIISLPSPAPLPRTFSGGTPLGTPHGTPVSLTSRSLADVTTATALTSQTSRPEPRPPPLTVDEESQNQNRIPGSYVGRSTRRYGLLPSGGDGDRGIERGRIGDGEHGIDGG